MSLEIVQYGSKILHKKGKRIESFGPSLKKLFHEMVESMDEAEGIGLAAQQVGLAIQFCVVDMAGMDSDFNYTLDGMKEDIKSIMPMAICNPRITPIPPEEITYEEGCLSFPEIRGDVTRPASIRCEYQDLDGGAHVLECDGLFAVCVQHEADHLNGILYIDRMSRNVLDSITLDIKKIRKSTIKADKSEYELDYSPED